MEKGSALPQTRRCDQKSFGINQISAHCPDGPGGVLMLRLSLGLGIPVRLEGLHIDKSLIVENCRTRLLDSI